MSGLDHPVSGSEMSPPDDPQLPRHSQGVEKHGRPMRLPILALGLSLGSFLSISFTLCVLFDLILPSMAMREAWMMFLPGFTWISWPSFLIGFVESFAYGLYVAFVFGPIFNLFIKFTARKQMS